MVRALVGGGRKDREVRGETNMVQMAKVLREVNAGLIYCEGIGWGVGGGEEGQGRAVGGGRGICRKACVV